MLSSGFVITGTVAGGVAASNTLELASASSAGVLTGLGGRNFTNFGTVVVDTGAVWTLSGSGTVAAGTTLSVLGTATENGTLRAAGVVSVGSGGTLGFGATGAQRLILVPGASLSGNIAGGSGTNTLELASAASTGTVSGLGVTITKFPAITLDGRARWSLAGSNTLSSGTAITLGASGTLTVAGTVIAGPTLALSSTGTLAVGATGTLEIGTVGGAAAGRLTVDAVNMLTGAGTIAGTVTDNGVMIANGGTLSITGGAGGTGVATIDASSVLNVTGSLTIPSVVFAGGSSTLDLGLPGSITSTISGFGTTNTIDLLGVVGTTASLAGTVVTVSGSGGSVATLHFTGSYAGHTFTVASDSHGGTNVTLV